MTKHTLYAYSPFKPKQKIQHLSQQELWAETERLKADGYVKFRTHQEKDHFQRDFFNLRSEAAKIAP